MAGALKLMDFKPVLLEASLVAILNWLPLALGTGIVGNVLLIEFPAIPLKVVTGCIPSTQLQQLLQRAHAILALADVNKLIVMCSSVGLRAVVLQMMVNIVVHFIIIFTKLTN